MDAVLMMLMMAALVVCMINLVVLMVLVVKILGPQADTAKYIAEQNKAEATYRRLAAANKADDEEAIKQAKKEHVEQQKALDALFSYNAYCAYDMKPPSSKE